MDSPRKSTREYAGISTLYSVPVELLVLAGSTWSGLACVVGALVVVMARSNWFVPSMLSALTMFGMPALVALGWRYWPRAERLAEGDRSQKPHRLKLRVGPEEWGGDRLPAFATVPGLQMPHLDFESMRTDLVHEVTLQATAQLRPAAQAKLPFSRKGAAERPPLVVVTPPRDSTVTCCLRIAPPRPGSEPEVCELLLEAKVPLPLLNVVPTLVNLHDHVEDTRWAISKRHGPRLFLYAVLACTAACRALLMVAEVLMQVRLQHVRAVPRGPTSRRQLAFYFSGHVLILGCIRCPFFSVRLPSFVLPSAHAHLSTLLSKEPLATARIRNHHALPISSLAASLPDLLASFEITSEAAVEAPSLDAQVHLEDATLVTADVRPGSWTGCSPQINARVSLSGNLRRDSLDMSVKSIRINELEANGKLELTSMLPGGTPLLEALAEAAVDAVDGACNNCGRNADVKMDRDRRGRSPRALARVSTSWMVREASPLIDLYAKGTVSHSLMRCGHESFGAARKLTLGGSFEVVDAELHGGGGWKLDFAFPTPPVVDLRFEAGELEIPDDNPGTGWQNSDAQVTTLITGRTTTKMSLAAGRLSCHLKGGAGSLYMFSGEYSGDVIFNSEYEAGQIPELGLLWSDFLRTQSRVQLTGSMHAQVNVEEKAAAILQGTEFNLLFSDTSVCLGPRMLRFPDGTELVIQLTEFAVSDDGCKIHPCLDLRWKTGLRQSPMLSDRDSGLPELELLPPSMREGALRVRINPVGRVSIEDLQQVGVSPRMASYAMTAGPLTPALLVLNQRRCAQRQQASNALTGYTLSRLLDPSSPEGSERWSELLESREFEDNILLLCAILSPDIHRLAKEVIHQCHRVCKVLEQAGIKELKDIIPAEKLAEVLSNLLSDSDVSKIYEKLYPLVKGTIDGNGIDVPRIKELLVTHIPILEDYPFEVDRSLRILNIFMSPTPPIPPIARQYLYPLAQRQEHQSFLHGVPSAAEIYEVVDDHDSSLQPEWAERLASVAPLLTIQQLEYILKSSKRVDWPQDAHARLTYVLELKHAVARISADWGSFVHLPQTHVVALLLGKAIHASLGWPGQAMSSLPAEAAFLACMRGVSTVKQPPAEPERTPTPSANDQRVANLPSLNRMRNSSSENMTSRSTPNARRNRTSLSFRRLGSDVSNAAPEASSKVISGSLLGPADVAALLRSGLAGIQTYIAQTNFRMLLELALSQPPVFLRGVLYELSDDGSPRALTQMLLRLVNVEQHAFREPIDIAALFESHLGVNIPRRREYMAGGRWSRQSYYQAMMHSAAMILDEAEPYLAVQSHLQVARNPEDGDVPGIPAGLASDGLSPGIENLTRRAIEKIREADQRGELLLQNLGSGRMSSQLKALLTPKVIRALNPWHDSSETAAQTNGSMQNQTSAGAPDSAVASAASAYRDAFVACRAVLRLDSRVVLGRDWFRAFWRRNHEALMIECLVSAVQQDVDHARLWLAAQPGVDEKALVQHKFGVGSWEDEQWLIDCLIDITYYFPEDRNRIRRDPLVRLLLTNDSSERYDFTVISVMGVVSQGADGFELENVYRRYEAQRGVKFIRANTGTAKSHAYNADKVEEAIQKVTTQAFGMIGYSQGGANMFKAESNLCGGTPEQRALASGLRCRNFLFPAANGSAQASCGEWKITRAIVEIESFMKHHQVTFSAALQEAFLDILLTVLTSRELYLLVGGVHSLTHLGVQTLWREAQHKDGVPTTSMRGVVEAHTMPEPLELLSAWYHRQLESPLHDTQVALDEAVGHPVYVHNTNSAMLARCDQESAVQRMSHWAPLDEDTKFITTAKDVRRRLYDIPKDRFVYPWIELNARFGFIPKVADEDPGAARGMFRQETPSADPLQARRPSGIGVRRLAI